MAGLQLDLPAGLLQSTMVYPPKGQPQNQEYLITRVWSNFIQQQIVNRLTSSPQIVQTVPRTGLNDNVTPQTINIGTVTAGLYRISYYVRITTPAGVSNSITVNIGFIDGGVTCTMSGTPVTALSTAAVGTGVFMIRSDQAAPISYSVTYASNPANACIYKLDVLAELV
jgi:hypothetical protein